MREDIELHPLQAKGKYYVDQGTCLQCATCYYYAPDNFKYDGETLSSYVAKQPETPDEEARCRKALTSCAVEAIYDDGDKSWR